MNTKTGSQYIVSSLLKVIPLILILQQSPRTNTDYMWSNPLPVIKQLHDRIPNKSG